MKIFAKLCLFSLLILAISCSKDNIDKNCSLFINNPNIKFRVVSITDGKDLFFSDASKYQLSDISIKYKNDLNKIDSIAPATETSGLSKNFLYRLPTLRLIDTSYIKITNLKPDTIYTTLKMTKNVCGLVYSITNIKINNQPAITYSNDTILILKK